MTDQTSKPVPTNAASSGVTLDRQQVKQLMKRSDRPGHGLGKIPVLTDAEAVSNHVDGLAEKPILLVERSQLDAFILGQRRRRNRVTA